MLRPSATMWWMGDRVLLQTAGADDACGAIVRSGRRVWLADGDPPRPATTLEERRIARMGLRDGQMLAGGHAPPASATAYVTTTSGQRVAATVGSGFWLVVLEQPARADLDLPVCFHDEDGQLIAPDLPGHWQRELIEDADEPCPACTAAPGWLMVTPGRDDPVAVCAACGHQETLGCWFGADSTPQAARPQPDWAEEFHRREVAPMLATIDFAIYTPAGLPVSLGGWGGDARRTDRVTIVYENTGVRVAVETAAGRDHGFADDAEHARDALEAALDNEPQAWPDRSPPALSLWLNARQRLFARTAARAQQSDRRLAIAGQPTTFTALDAQDCWSAVGRVDDLTITISARGVLPHQLHLESVADPTALRLAPR